MNKITERKIKWHPKTLRINQIPKEGLEYAFLSKDYVQIHQLVWCKDFMQDAIYAHVNGTVASIYGFKYDPSKDPPIYEDKTRIMVNSFKDKSFETKVLNNLSDFIHQIESELKMTPTVFEKVSNPHSRYKKSGVFIANGSKRWMKAPPMISLYTLLLRVGLMHTVGDKFSKTMESMRYNEISPYYGSSVEDNDVDFLKQTQKGFDRIMTHGDRKLFHRDIAKNYPKYNKYGSNFSINSMHENCGMVGFSSDSTSESFPHWHRDIK